ncbi:DEAD/DEAH box helicase [Ferrimonas marina]|uniref:Superfamily II DNA and RNA helicase n=1 Tax=Ferrimonas marina TaxID=299255 RepID=A0A1M5N0R3_9GAMM|nr:DEAD/DEAH box helicase [Ferrimonas marina]SHG83121.1 Superfamily II DNA and RNA helicase [Ferrimonas marina]
MTFSQLGLSAALTDPLASLGYQAPTPIQQQAIPLVLQGRDLIAAAQTGTGKTAAYLLPLLQRLDQQGPVRPKRVHALVLVPTRELAQQVANSVQAYGKGLSLSVLAAYGGTDTDTQSQALNKGVDLLVATPGRLRDLLTRRALHLDAVTALVLDEADRMLDLGFIDAINAIVDRLPDERQTLLFSATLGNQVRALGRSAMVDPAEITLAKHKASKAQIEQWLVTVDKDKKSALLSHLIQDLQWQQALIFVETKHGAAKLVTQLAKRGIEADCIHSGRSQAVREQVLARFKAGELAFLVATGVAARGLDVAGLERVVNYDLPYPPDDYVHRIGRTGRADAQGEAVALLSKDDFKNLCMIESRLGHLIERRVVEGFEPRKPVPVSILNYVPKARRNDKAKGN